MDGVSESGCRCRAKGNTVQLDSYYVKGAEESGHSVEVISLVKSEV